MLRRPLCVRSGVTVTITGANFFKPGDGDGRVHVRWVLDTSPQTGEALTFYLSFADFVSASTLVTLSPKIPESFTEDTRYTDTAGVTDAYSSSPTMGAQRGTASCKPASSFSFAGRR